MEMMRIQGKPKEEPSVVKSVFSNPFCWEIGKSVCFAIVSTYIVRECIGLQIMPP